MEENSPQETFSIFSTLKRSPAHVESICIVSATMGYTNGLFSTEICGLPKWLMSIVHFVPTFLRSVPISQFCLFLTAHYLTNSKQTAPSTYYTAPLWNLLGMGTNLYFQNNFSTIRCNLENILTKLKTHSDQVEILSIVYYASPFVFYTMGHILGKRCAPVFQTWVQERIKFMFDSTKSLMNKN